MTNDIRVEVDYNGNIYLRYRQRIYNIFFDEKSENGIELAPISETTYEELMQIADDHPHLADHVIRGKIVLSDSTLKGRVTQVLSELDPEELDDEAEQNMLNHGAHGFKEESFFRIVRCDGDNEDDLENDWDIMDTDERYTISHDLEYRFSGVKEVGDGKPESIESKSAENDTGLCFSDEIYFAPHLSDSMSHNDTLMIRGGRESKIITSCVQRTDRFCTRRLFFYSECGEIKVQFPSSHSVRLRVVAEKGQLTLELIDRYRE
jgi:hypothetical protein